MSSDELDTVQNAGLATYAELSEGADVTLSREIADKDKLVGKPFIITAARFSKSDVSEGDFVSLEITTADDEQLILNDGSTGIRRQTVQYLTSKRWINPGDGVEVGKETRYDSPCSEWSFLDTAAEFRITDDGKASAVIPSMRLRVKHGLRMSEYDSVDAKGKPTRAKTYYLN